MVYSHFSRAQFFKTFGTEKKVRDWLWQTRFPSGYQCPHCQSPDFYEHVSRPEVRTCLQCQKQIRLRAGTLFEHSKLPLRLWLQAIQLLMQGKRGISALELKRVLGIGSYRTAWQMLHKIRAALNDRDQQYKLQGVIELDGAYFGHKENKKSVLVAIESKDWVDDHGKPKTRAGFAKIELAVENRENAQSFIDHAIQKNSFVNTDGKPSYHQAKNVNLDYQTSENLEWMPWVHKFISNAKTWMRGTHHSVRSKYLNQYLAEYTYRFNRRHDPDGLFQRTLKACVLASPKRVHALCG